MSNYASGLSHPSARNLTGKTFSGLTVVSYVGVVNGRNHWLCKCKCDQLKQVSSHCLIQGTVKFCSRKCLYRSNYMKSLNIVVAHGLKHPRVTDIRGLRFGGLVVVDIVKFAVYGRTRWVCLCDCGNKKLAYGDHLKRGAVKYCSKKCVKKPKAKNQYTKKLEVING
jgi:hypothetical protein